MQIFILVRTSVIEILLFNQKQQIMKKWQICSTTRFSGFFSDIISFQHVLHFDVGRNQIERNQKVKTEIPVSIVHI